MNENDQYTLSKESIKEEIFSSNTHNMQLLSDEVHGMPMGHEYEIPQRYNLDMLVFMPVNLETVFLYWEVTSTLLEEYHITLERLRTKVYVLDDDQETALNEFQVSTELGKYYLHFKAAMKRVQARMGFYNEYGEFVVILHSNLFRMPNESIELSEDEVWMSIDESTRVILRASIHNEPDNFSSRGLLKEKILEISKLSGQSSRDLIKRGI